MKEYTEFAYVYDELMDNVPYEEWCEYVRSILCSYGIEDGLVLDLGCGSGVFTELLADRGYDMIGIDSSDDMLAVAMDKLDKSGHDILYLLQDMREFELYGTVRAIVSVCDCLNYITEPDELAGVFGLVHNYLDNDGLFIFDMNTEYKFKTVLSDNVYAENRDDCSFIWENYYDSDSKINEYALTIFSAHTPAKEQREEQTLYERHEEYHYQKAYSVEEITKMIENAGLTLLNIYDAYTMDEPNPSSERLSYICVKRK